MMKHETEPQDIDPEMGETLAEWSFIEYERGGRTRRWYIGAGVIATGLLIYALASGSFTFAFLIVLFVAVYFLLEYHEIPPMRFVITTAGISVGRRFVPYADIENFWIVYSPPDVANIYFLVNTSFGSRLTVPLGDADPVAIRATLLNFLPEDLTQEEAPIAESIGRILKL